jgi:hypothetical protein
MLWKLKVNYSDHKIPTLVLILNQITPLQFSRYEKGKSRQIKLHTSMARIRLTPSSDIGHNVFLTSPNYSFYSVNWTKQSIHTSHTFSFTVIHIYLLHSLYYIIRILAINSAKLVLPSNKQNKLHGLSPRANYTDRATAACRRS